MSQVTRYKEFIQIDQYLIDKNNSIGSGSAGLSSVYIGYQAENEDKVSEKLYAIKEISIKSNASVANSLIKEINFLRRLQHTNIVGFVDAKLTEFCFYLIMEYCMDGNLESYIQKKDFSERKVLDLFGQMLYAFRYLYINNIFHRDIKPSNILVHNGIVKLGDFGLSKIITNDQQLQAHTMLVGTPYFMAPEILAGGSWEPKSDIWSLGITFYYMLFKKYPWEDTLDKVLLLQRIQERLGMGFQPKSNDPQLQSQTIELLSKMLKVKVEERISWDELIEVNIIKPFLEQEKQQSQQKPKQLVQQTMEDLTTNQIMLKENVVASNQEFHQYQLLDTINKKCIFNFQTQKKKYDREMQVKEKLEFELQKSQFFAKLMAQIKGQFLAMPQLIPKDLYQKCQFLLSKRSTIITQDLSKLLAFQLNQQGNIYIDSADWQCFMNNREAMIDIIYKVQYENEIASKRYTENINKLHDSMKKLDNFQLQHRGNAYLETKEENENLILAFNDNFVELFKILSQELFKVIEKHNLHKYNSKTVLTKYKIDICLIYYLIILLCFYNLFKNNRVIDFDQLYSNTELVNPSELIQRIKQTFDKWIQEGKLK